MPIGGDRIKLNWSVSKRAVSAGARYQESIVCEQRKRTFREVRQGKWAPERNRERHEAAMYCRLAGELERIWSRAGGAVIRRAS